MYQSLLQQTTLRLVQLAMLAVLIDAAMLAIVIAQIAQTVMLARESRNAKERKS